MIVRNINGTNDNSCKCGSWLEHWKKFSGRDLPSFCPEDKCSQKPEVGAHVQKENTTDTAWYIVPLCKSHSAETGKSLTVGSWAMLVSANVSETCGKK